MSDTPCRADTRDDSSVSTRRRLWVWRLIRQTAINAARTPLFFLIGFGALLGGLAANGYVTAVDATNTTEFCISCHEMRETMYVEYIESAHYKNAAGVRATCSDCHVPKAGFAKLARKILAVMDIYHSVLGTIDTPEKFEARRAQMAETVWAYMLESRSRECRGCHSFDSMDFHKQSRRASEKMQQGMEEGKTCIECHKGVAHKMPAKVADD